MSFEILLICVHALAIQGITAQCIGAYNGYDLDGFTYTPVTHPANLAASNGPGLAISSTSALIPAGVSVLSENVYTGEVAVGGAIPFLGTVALEGALPTVGAGAIVYDCGDEACAITAEDLWLRLYC